MNEDFQLKIILGTYLGSKAVNEEVMCSEKKANVFKKKKSKSLKTRLNKQRMVRERERGRDKE